MASPDPASPMDLADRERSVLSELARSGDARVAFQGLRRRLALHQMALTRTLRRLAASGLVSRDAAGYQLTDRGRLAAGAPTADGVRGKVLLEANLPTGIGPGALAQHLARRWFRGLRWYGESWDGRERVLTWLSESDGTGVRVRLAADRLRLELDEGSEASGWPAARAVLAALAEAYGLPPEAPEDAAACLFAPGSAA